MAAKLGGLGAVLAAALVLGVGGAAGRALATTEVSVSVIGGGKITGGGGQITCGGGNTSCYATYVTGTSVTLSIASDSSSSWSSTVAWDGCSTETTTTCTIDLATTSDEQFDIEADFNPVGGPPGTYTLSVNVTGDADDNGGNVSGSGIDCDPGDEDCTWDDVYAGSTLTLVEESDDGFEFSGWGGACSGTATSCTVVMSSDQTVNAAFAAAPTNQTLTVTVTGNGTVTGGGISCTSAGGSGCTASVANGTTVTLTATPSSGTGFSGWGGACAGSSTSCTVTMDAAKTVTATFTGSGGGGSTFPLSVSVTGNGKVTGSGIDCGAGKTSCSQNIASGTTVTLTATPSSSASFTGWGGSCTGTATTCTVTMTAARSVSATFTGGTTGGSTFALTVSVAGDGAVTGSGISCGSGATDCTESVTAGTSVTLTATPDSGASFSGWSGACSGTTTTCTVTMTSARSVTATFSGASGTKVLLKVSVQGPGKVSGGGIACGAGSNTCSAQQSQGATITLVAAPSAGATFVRWGGACSGTTPTCTVAMAAARSVTATFGAGAGGAAAALHSRGRPIVTRTKSGFAVTLRFQTSVRGAARVRALRAGRLETAFSFAAPVGRASVGPFPLAKPGFYRFELRLGGHGLNWTACLGRCAKEAAAAGRFTLARQPSAVVRAGALWSLTLHFRSTQPAGADLRVYRSKRLIRELQFATHAGQVSANPLLLSPGSYTVRLVALDAYGRVRTLTWIALLP
jgi:hypothetical protein